MASTTRCSTMRFASSRAANDCASRADALELPIIGDDVAVPTAVVRALHTAQELVEVVPVLVNVLAEQIVGFKVFVEVVLEPLELATVTERPRRANRVVCERIGSPSMLTGNSMRWEQ